MSDSVVQDAETKLNQLADKDVDSTGMRFVLLPPCFG